jgi:replicative DNA helicase
VCFFSLEMTKAALAMRVACDVTYDRGAPVYAGQPSSPTFNAAMKGELEPHQWRQIDEASDIIDGWPLVIDDRSGLNMAQIEAAARRQHRRWERQGIKPGPVIIDHLGKVRPMTDRKGSKHAEVADVSADAQSMAKRLGVPVLALVQLNRGVEGRDDKRPQLSDLRQAGELEEDARQVIFLFRPEYYVRDGAPDESFEERTKRVEKLDQCRNQLLWLVEKNSHGPRGQVQTFCEIACSAIRDWDR